MRQIAGWMCVGLTLAGGCAPPEGPPAVPPSTPPPPVAQRASLQQLQDRPATATERRSIAASAAPQTSAETNIVARVGTRTITAHQLLAPMLEAHGLSFLLHLVQLELARQAAAQHGVTVTPEDIKKERELTFDRMFKDSDEAIRARIQQAIDDGDNDTAERLKAELKVDREALLDQYLVQQYAQSRQYVSRPEFDIVLETNAHLRKIAEASPELTKALTEENLRKAFAAQYGEKVVVRHIQANNIAEISEARRRLQAGENFADVAKALSVNKNTAPLGGALPPFTMNATNVPEVFKQTAFALEDGEISDTVQADGAYHIIKVENRIEPKVVKYEDVKDNLRDDLYDKILQAAVKQLRDKLAAQVLANLQIEHPVLKAQFDRRLEEGKVRQAQIDEAMKRDRAVTAPENQDAEQAAADSTTAPAAPAVTQPADASK